MDVTAAACQVIRQAYRCSFPWVLIHVIAVGLLEPGRVVYRAVAGRPLTWRSSRSTGAARAAESFLLSLFLASLLPNLNPPSPFLLFLPFFFIFFFYPPSHNSITYFSSPSTFSIIFSTFTPLHFSPTLYHLFTHSISLFTFSSFITFISFHFLYFIFSLPFFIYYFHSFIFLFLFFPSYITFLSFFTFLPFLTLSSSSSFILPLPLKPL